MCMHVSSRGGGEGAVGVCPQQISYDLIIIVFFYVFVNVKWNLKTLFNIVEAQFEKLLNFDVCGV